MNSPTSKQPAPHKETLLTGVITLEELSSKLKVNPDDLERTLEAEKVPFKKIGGQIFLKIGVARQFIMCPNHNKNQSSEIEVSGEPIKDD